MGVLIAEMEIPVIRHAQFTPFCLFPSFVAKVSFFVFNAPCFSEFEKTWRELILWLVMQHKVWRTRGTEPGRKSLGVGKKIGGKCLQIWNSVGFQKHGCLQRCTVLVKFYPFFSLLIFSLEQPDHWKTSQNMVYFQDFFCLWRHFK